MKTADILFIMLFAFSALALTLGSQDSIGILVSGGTTIGFQKASGLKADEDGLP